MKFSSTLLLVTLFVVSCTRQETANLQLTGNISGLKKGTLYIQKIIDSTLTTIDTIRINGDAHFSSELNIDAPEMYYLHIDRGTTKSLDDKLSFFAEPGTINIESSLEHFLSDAVVTGSKNQDKYNEFKKIMSRFNDEDLSLLELKFNAYKDHKGVQMDSIEKKQEINTKRKYLYVTNFAITNSTMEVAPYVTLTEIPDINLKYMDTIQKAMTPKISNSLYGKKLKQLIAERKRKETLSK